MKCTGESGMSLVELMLAAGVMAVGLSMLFGSLVGLSAVNKITEDRASAVAQLSAVMEEIQPLNYDGVLKYQPPQFTYLGPLETVTVNGYKADGTTEFSIPVSPTAPPTGLPTGSGASPLRVKVTIAWYDNKHRPFAVNASRLFYK